jgi:hypothetical protein
MHLRKLIMGAAALAMPLTAVATVAATSTASAVTVGKGLYNCTKVTGTITFSPALKNGGVSPETSTVTTTATGCKSVVGHTAKPLPTKVIGKAKITSSTNDCANLATPRPATLKLTYTPLVAGSTLAATESETVVGTAVTFQLSGSLTGSYPSSSATGKGKLTQTSTQLGAACGGAGLAKVTIASGSLTNF